MNKYQEALDRLQWEENFQKGNEIEILREIVEQYRPPTFDEVVKAWEDIGYRIEIKTGGAIHAWLNDVNYKDTDLRFLLVLKEMNLMGYIQQITYFFYKR